MSYDPLGASIYHKATLCLNIVILFLFFLGLSQYCLLVFTAGLPDMNSGGNTGQSFNPAFVHMLAVPEVDMLDKVDQICVVARGDGVVDVINIESELSAMRSKTSTKPRRGSQSRSKESSPTADIETSDQNGRKRLCLDYSLGGHTAAVSCV